MGKGSVYGSERAILHDARSGLRIVRLTHYSTISMNLYFEMDSFTEDEQFVVFLSQRGAGRDAPWDLFRGRTDGLELVQMTQCDDLAGIVVTPAAHSVLYQSDGALHSVDIASLEERIVTDLADVAPAAPFSLASADARGTVYFASGVKTPGTGILYKVDVASGKTQVLFEGAPPNHIHADPAGKTVYFNELREDGAISCLVDSAGQHVRPYPFKQFAHTTWLGETGRMQGCLLPPGHAIVTYAEGDAHPAVITEGRYYWHSSPSRDAQWIVADTNWPREGLYLVHLPTRTVTYVCDPQSSCSHPQWSHPHPSLSPGLRYVLFNSDRTGIGQVYVAELTDEFRIQASSGYCCKPVLA